MNPLAGNPLVTRRDLQNAVLALIAPLEHHTSPGGARIVPGAFAAAYSTAGAGLEGFARRLWGLAPLAAGGGAFDGWPRLRAGLTAGTDPADAEYWGDPVGMDVRSVEMASLGTALTLAKPFIWDPLSPAAKDNVERWMRFANTQPMVDNNWKFFCVLGNLGLEAVGREPDREATQAAIDRIEAMYLGDGWYSDGITRQRDYYISFAIHYYALLYATTAKQIDPELAKRYRERAAVFAQDFSHWFNDAGAALPFGRSLTYRFAQGSFWGALAYANVEALPWGVIKGMLLRHLRWWAQQPIFTEGGVLSIGYAYPNLIMAESYNAPGSPYWALKAFLPTALAEDHPFWRADEAPLPPRDAVRVMSHAGMVVCRDEADDHVVALATGQWVLPWPQRHTEQKYSKFAYSTAFGFCINAGQSWADNMLSFSEDGRHWAGRVDSVEHRIDANELYSKWRPMPEVEVETWIRPRGRWHVRVHRIRTARTIQTVEAGFAASAGEGDIVAGRDTAVGEGWSLVQGASGSCGIRDLIGGRVAEISAIEPNVNLLYPRAITPLLRQTLEPGTHVFAVAILGCVQRQRFDESWLTPPSPGKMPPS